MRYSKLKDQKGLTIIEAMVAMLILSLGLIPTLAVLTSALQISAIIENNLIAANLAQEGVEVARSLRDSNWFSETADFEEGLIGTWRVDSTTNFGSNPPLPTTTGTNVPIKFDPATGLYNYSTGEDTVFKRAVTVSLSANPCNCELVVISEVTWTWRNQPRVVQVESHLYNWW